MKNENHSYLLSGKTIGNNSDDDDDDKIENKTNAYTLWIYTSNICQTNKHKCFFVWQGHFQRFEFLLTPWIDILPISPSGVIQKEFFLKYQAQRDGKKEKYQVRKKFDSTKNSQILL